MLWLCAIVVGLVGAGCGGEKGSGGGGAESAEGCAPEGCGGGETEKPAEAAAATTGTAVVKGVVKFNGQPPRRRTIDTGADAYCKQNAQGLLEEGVVVNPDSTLMNVFVHVKSGLTGKYEAPKETVLLDQKGCQYAPHVLGVQVGQTLVVRNSDPTLHNVKTVSKKGQEINVAQSQKGMEHRQVFRREEVMVEFKCDVHGWMGAYVAVVKHPFFAVTGDKGNFEIRNLPAGEYTLEAWHETYGAATQSVTVKDGESKDVEFTFTRG
jgi:plastocyanin